MNLSTNYYDFRADGPLCQTIIYATPSGKLTATPCLEPDDDYVKGSYKTDMRDQTKQLDIYNLTQIVILVCQTLLQIFEFYAVRQRHHFGADPPPRHVNRIPNIIVDA